MHIVIISVYHLKIAAHSWRMVEGINCCSAYGITGPKTLEEIGWFG